MKNNFNEKVRLIRESEYLSRLELAKKLGISHRTLEGIENRGTDPGTSFCQKLCNEYPKYTMWLMLDITNVKNGQIAPHKLTEVIKTNGK